MTLLELLQLMRKHLKLMIVLPIVCALATAVVCFVALLAGLFVAIAIVVVSDMLNTKVRNADEVEELLGLPVIGRMPAVKGGK